MSLNALYIEAGISRQGFHQWLGRRFEEAEELALLRPIVEQIRMDHPRMSAKVIYRLVRPTTLGRDRFIGICAEWGLLLSRERSPIRTTDSLGVTRFLNLLEGAEVTYVNQFWTSDITYYQLGEQVYYITLVLEIFSRRIIGWQLSDTLRTEHTTLPALRMALRLRRGKDLTGLVFHSDGGGQYYCKEFLKILRDKGIASSMCEHAWENPYSERVNGTVKNDYIRQWDPRTRAELANCLDRAVKLINEQRPHSSLNYNTPLAVDEHPGLFTELTVINKEKRTKREKSQHNQQIELTEH